MDPLKPAVLEEDFQVGVSCVVDSKRFGARGNATEAHTHSTAPPVDIPVDREIYNSYKYPSRALGCDGYLGPSLALAYM